MFISCNPVLMKLCGTKNPKMETFTSINKYANSLGIDSINVIFSKDSTSFTSIVNIFGGFQELLIFDSKKQYMPYKNNLSNCNATVESVLLNICNIKWSSNKPNREINFDTLMSFVVDPNNHEQTDTIQYDYILFMNFTKYFQGVNESHISVWNRILKDRSSTCTIKIYYINLDYLESWKIKGPIPKIKLGTKNTTK